MALATSKPAAADLQPPTAEAFRSLVETALALHRTHRAKFLERHIRGVSVGHALREFCTVHIDVGRGAGKTTAIQALAKAGDVVVLHSHPMVRLFGPSVARVLVGNRWDDWEEAWYGLNVTSDTIVWVDEAALTRLSGPADWLYDRLAFMARRATVEGGLPTIVMLGSHAPAPTLPGFIVRGKGQGDLGQVLRLAMRFGGVRRRVVVAFGGLERAIDADQAMHYLSAMVVSHLGEMEIELTPGARRHPDDFRWVVLADSDRDVIRVDGS